MEMQTETVLSDNGIPPRKEGNDFRCSICMVDTICRDWQKHIESPRHVGTLERFNFNFDKTPTGVVCKVCSAKLGWEVLKTHANKHKWVPWYEPPDRYKIFFNNHIIEWESQFYCYPCDFFLPEWSTAYVHTCDERHHHRLQEEPEVNDFASWTVTEVPYEIFVTEGFLSNLYNLALDCTICDCSSIGIRNVASHVKGYQHTRMKEVFLQELRDRRDHKFKQQSYFSLAKPLAVKLKARDTGDNENAVDSLYENSSSLYIVRMSKYDFYCEICNTEFSVPSIQNFNTSLDYHQKGSTHTAALKTHGYWCISVMEPDNTYRCTCCDCLVLGVENVHQHVRGNRHKNSLSQIKNPPEQAPTVQTEIATKQSSFSLPKNHIEKRNSSELYCKLCKEVILGNTKVQKHIIGKTHVSGEQQFSSNICFNNDSNYYCRCCDCTILGVENVYSHVNGIRHAKSINGLPRRVEETKVENLGNVETPKKSDKIGKSAGVSLPSDHIDKDTDTVSCWEICNFKNVAASAVDGRVSGKRYADAVKNSSVSDEISLRKNDEYHCKSWKSTTYGIDNVYAQLQGKRHESCPNKADKTHGEECTNSADPGVGFSIEDGICYDYGFFSASTSNSAIHVSSEIAPSKESGNIVQVKDSCSEVEQKDPNGIAGLQLTTEIKGLKKTKLEKHDAKTSSNSLQINGTTILTKESDPERSQRSSKKPSMQRIVQLLNFDNDYIHDMRDKLRETELGMKLCLMTKSRTIYCLVCKEEIVDTMQNYLKHLSSADHCESLEGMEKDHDLFELFPGQYSELDLVCQYMEEISEDTVHCHACNKDIVNIDNILKDHIKETGHEETCRTLHLKAKTNFEDIKSRLQCDWYDIHRYWCVPCSEYFEHELSFSKHLKSKQHAMVMEKSRNSERGVIYDFCSPCALLWFGFRCTYTEHCEDPAHKLKIWNGHNKSQNLPKSVEIHLAALEQYIDETIEHFDELSVRERDKEETLIRDIEMTVKFEFPGVKVFTFGSRVSGLRRGDSDVEIFLDCGNMYDGKESSEYHVLSLKTRVRQCLSKDQRWDVDELFTKIESSNLKARHRAAGLTCEISFENGLAVEGMQLIKYFTDNFPHCRKLILFLNQWLALCNLVRPQGISNYALYWCVIFYLQKESSLPSVASLLGRKGHSHLIAGWEVSVPADLTFDAGQGCSLSVREFLTRFFTFYNNFDYRYDIACPLLGYEMRKRVFADPQSLPKEMAPYIEYLKSSTDSRPFRIDNVMCVQDPLNLQRNVTEAVSKAYLCQFRAYCSKSLDILRQLQK